MESFRMRAALGVLLVVPLGLAVRRVSDFGGSILYEVLWCLAAAFVVPRWRSAPIAIAVFAATCIVEFLQLWHPPFLQWARGHFLGRSILGTDFDWADFPSYAVGSVAGYFCLRALRRAA
jgi:hypothetical protein